MSALNHSDPILPQRSGFRLDKVNGKFMGVCAGIANYFGWDATVVRVIWALAVLLGFGSPILIYLAIGLIAN
jgi:phage shock protein PspC (stress-responsive transcriptional regulator)